MQVTESGRRERRSGTFARRPSRLRRPLAPTKRLDRILLLLLEHRALTSTQIAERLALEGYSQQHTARLLSEMLDHGYIHRLGEKWPREYREGGGSAPIIYALGDAGAMRLGEVYGIARSSARWRDKNRDIKPGQIKHCLLVAEVLLAFERSCLARGDVRVIYPRELLALAPPETAQAPRPLQWQVETSVESKKLKLAVKPDKLFGLEFTQLPEGRNRVWFALEADRGTETITPVAQGSAEKSTLFHKYLGYRATREAGLLAARFGWHSFRVLTVTERNGVQVVRDRSGALVKRTRVENMAEAATLTAQSDKDYIFFLFTDLASLKREPDVLTLAWSTARGRPAMLDIKR